MISCTEQQKCLEYQGVRTFCALFSCGRFIPHRAAHLYLPDSFLSEFQKYLNALYAGIPYPAVGTYFVMRLFIKQSKRIVSERLPNRRGASYDFKVYWRPYLLPEGFPGCHSHYHPKRNYQFCFPFGQHHGRSGWHASYERRVHCQPNHLCF